MRGGGVWRGSFRTLLDVLEMDVLLANESAEKFQSSVCEKESVLS